MPTHFSGASVSNSTQLLTADLAAGITGTDSGLELTCRADASFCRHPDIPPKKAPAMHTTTVRTNRQYAILDCIIFLIFQMLRPSTHSGKQSSLALADTL
jgi:hypothetical protein